MNRSIFRRPSPATVISCLALFVSLGGVSYGVAKNSIDSREIKNNIVSTKDLKNNDIRSGDIRAGTVASSDIKDDTVAGGDVLESSLGKVPSAGAADTAGTAANATTAGNAGTVDGVNAARMFFRAPDGTGPTEVLNLGGLVIKADCDPLDEVDAVATTTVPGSAFTTASLDVDDSPPTGDNGRFDLEFNPGDTVDLIADDDDRQVGSFRFATQSGSLVTGDWTTEDDFPGTTCMFGGHALQSGG